MLHWLSRVFSKDLEEFTSRKSRIQLWMRLSHGRLRPRRASPAGMRAK